MKKKINKNLIKRIKFLGILALIPVLLLLSIINVTHSYQIENNDVTNSNELSTMQNGVNSISQTNLDNNLIAYFKFDDNLNNEESSDITATWDGSAFSGDSIKGKSAKFSGNSSIQISGLAVDDFSNQGATISFWSKGTSGWAYYWQSNNSNHYTGVQYDSAIIAKYHKNADNDASANGLSLNKWHLITVTYSRIPNNASDTLEMKLYIDGVEMVTKTDLSSFFSEIPLSFYIGGNNTNYFSGLIDEFKIYNCVLTAEDIVNEMPDPPAIVWFDGTLEDSKNTVGHLAYEGATNRLANAQEDFVVSNNVTYVKLPTSAGTTINYDYQLTGWYDIYSGKYYSPGDLVPITALGNEETGHNTVFYADWWAKNYNLVDKSKTQVSDDLFEVSNSFITTNVFDYNELFNANSGTATLQKVKLDKTGHDETWTDTNNRIAFVNVYRQGGTLQNLNGRNDINHDHTDTTDGSRGSENYYLGIVTSGLLDKGARSLFTTKDSLGVNYLGKGDSLYQYDSNTGYYYYDSKINAASYDQSAGRFHVYEETEKVGGYSSPSASDFLPLNSGKNGYYSGFTDPLDINYWFGFSSFISFYLPANVGSEEGKVKNVSEGEREMNFTFTGDDDVWIFIDGELILDMGGIHDVVFGSINFATGEVLLGQNGTEVNDPNYYENSKGLPPTAKAAKNVEESETKLKTLKAGVHKLQILYMERGASESNCAVYFNLHPTASIDVHKSDAQTGALLPQAGFTLKNEDGKYYYYDEEDNFAEWKDEATTYYTDENGILSFGDLHSGTYTLNESVAPNGYELDTRDVNVVIIHNDGSKKKFDFEISSTDGVEVEKASDGITLTISFPNKHIDEVVENKEIAVKLAFLKVAYPNMNPLAGAEFKLFGSNYFVDNNVNEEATSLWSGKSIIDTSGVASWEEETSFPALVPGTYYLVETNPPKDYVKLNGIIKIDVYNDGKVDVALINTEDGTVIEKLVPLSKEQLSGWLVSDNGEVLYDYVFQIINTEYVGLPNTSDIITIAIVVTCLLITFVIACSLKVKYYGK